MLNIASDMGEKQGLDTLKWYEAIVINNDDKKHPDKMMLGRIQARIDLIFDGIKDADLPWAIPTWTHINGATALSGAFNVPKKNSKVYLSFQQGNPAFPMYSCFHVDVITQMEEVKHHYPNRVVTRFQNKAMIIMDTEDNIAYIRNPGKLKIYIDGDVALEINGDVDELVHGDVRRKVKGDLEETVVGNFNRLVTGNFEETVHGNIHRSTYGNLREEHEGNRDCYTSGNVTESVQGDTRRYTEGTVLLESGGNTMIEASNIFENSGNAQGDPHSGKSGNQTDVASTSVGGTVLAQIKRLWGFLIPTQKRQIGIPILPQQPRFYKWEKIPGSAKGTNTRNKPTKASAAQPCPEYAKDNIPLNVNPQILVDDELGPQGDPPAGTYPPLPDSTKKPPYPLSSTASSGSKGSGGKPPFGFTNCG